jgi:hypothetical protein
MILHDLFDWTNSGVGGAGLLLTVGAIWQATGAKKAAQEARQAVYHRNAADAFAETVRLAESCAEYLSLERPSEAAVRTRDLVARIPRDRAQFEQFLSADSDKLKLLESVFQQLAVQLTVGRIFEDKEEAQAAKNMAFEASRILSAVYGRLLDQIMRRDHE